MNYNEVSGCWGSRRLEIADNSSSSWKGYMIGSDLQQSKVSRSKAAARAAASAAFPYYVPLLLLVLVLILLHPLGFVRKTISPLSYLSRWKIPLPNYSYLKYDIQISSVTTYYECFAI